MNPKLLAKLTSATKLKTSEARKILLIGQKDTRKTSFILTAPRPLMAFVTPDEEANSLPLFEGEEGIYVYTPKSMKDFENMVLEISTDGDFKTIAVETERGLHDVFMHELGVPKGEVPPFKDPNGTRMKLKAGMLYVQDFLTSSRVNKHVIMTSHVGVDRDDDGNIIAWGADLPGTLLPGALNSWPIVMYMKSGIIKDAKGIETQRWWAELQNFGQVPATIKGNKQDPPRRLFDPTFEKIQQLFKSKEDGGK